MSKEFYRLVQSNLNDGRRLHSITFLDGALPNEAKTGHSWLVSDDEILFGSLGSDLDQKLREKLSVVSRRTRAKISTLSTADGECRLLVELHEPAPRLLLVGAGHIAQSLAHIASHLGFAIRIFDDRPDFVMPELFPAGTELVLGKWTEVGERMTPGVMDYVVIVTHAHIGDGDALVSLISHDVAYLGMIGSKKKVKQLMARAEESGVSRERLDKVFSPIGLAIGAETPEEIAISIIAEIVAIARGADPGLAGSCSITGRKG